MLTRSELRSLLAVFLFSLGLLAYVVGAVAGIGLLASKAVGKFSPAARNKSVANLLIPERCKMPLQRTRGNLIAASEGVYFPMENCAKHRVNCVVTRAVLTFVAQRPIAINELLETFSICRREVEAVASQVYDKKGASPPLAVTVGVMELKQLKQLHGPLVQNLGKRLHGSEQSRARDTDPDQPCAVSCDREGNRLESCILTHAASIKM
jgi:hypothetical protein